MPEILVPLVEGEIVEIEGKKFVRNFSLDKVVDSSLRVVPIYFGRIAVDEQFGDDPVQGDERRAFRESRLYGPYDSEDEAKKILEEEKANFGKYHKLGLKVLSKAVPEDERESLKATRYFRNSYGVKPHDYLQIGIESFVKQYEEGVEKINEANTGILKSLEIGYRRDVLDMKNEGLYGLYVTSLIDGSFVCVRSQKRRSGETYELSIETFGASNKKPTELFPIDAEHFDSNNLFQYEVHSSREEFVSLTPFEMKKDELRKYKSIKEVVKAYHLIPDSVEFLGKRDRSK